MSDFYDENGDLKKEKPLEATKHNYEVIIYAIPKQRNNHRRMNLEKKRI